MHEVDTLSCESRLSRLIGVKAFYSINVLLVREYKYISILHNKGGQELAIPEHVLIATRAEGEGGKHLL